MDNILHSYEQAQKDINLNNIPLRQPDGTYVPNQGQRKILNDPKYNVLRGYNNEISHLTTHKKALVREFLSYENPTSHLETTSNEKRVKLESKLEEIDTELALKEAELKRKKEDLFNRGIYLTKKESTQASSLEKVNNHKGRKWKDVLSLVGIWLLLEGFMTAIQWTSLRDNRSIDEILVRSLALAVLLFFFHLISHRNKIQKRPIYSVYLGFNLLMIAVMMFIPPLLYHLYPIVNNASNISDWSIVNNDAATAVHNEISNPLWVEFYRQNEWAPAGASLLFFIVIFFALPALKEKNATVIDSKDHDIEKNATQSHVEQGLSYIQQEINDLKRERNELVVDINTLDTHPGYLLNILRQLEAKKDESLAIDKKIADLKIVSESLLVELERELDEYSIEFQDILKNDEVKSSFIKPQWPNRQDIFNYYKIQAV